MAKRKRMPGWLTEALLLQSPTVRAVVESPEFQAALENAKGLEEKFESLQHDRAQRIRLGRNIELLMSLRYMSLTKASKLCGYTRSHLSRIMNGQARFSENVLLSFTRVFEVSPQLLLGSDLQKELIATLDRLDKNQTKPAK